MALYSQGTQRIEVIVRKEDSGAATGGANEKAPEEAGKNPNAVDQNGGEEEVTQTSSRHIGRITTMKVAAASIAVGRMYLNYWAGGIAYRNGDSAQQEAVQRNVEVAEESVALLASVGMGAAFGARGGPWGVAVGAILGLATTATSLGFKYASKEREYNYKIFKEENTIEYKRARANLSLTTGRLR